jgi:hypothetical protein
VAEEEAAGAGEVDLLSYRGELRAPRSTLAQDPLRFIVMTKLTLEQQRDLSRRMAEGFQFGNDMQELEARQRSETEKWIRVDELLQHLDVSRSARLFTEADAAECGLVLQQQRFMKLRTNK